LSTALSLQVPGQEPTVVQQYLTLEKTWVDALLATVIPGTANNALAACVQAADQKYKDTWDALCGQMGKPRRCADFLGSPRDREFSQLRVEEMTLCSKLYR